ncbi:MAG TPA: crosslink repair DNA glycosylase YcaQ family protein [Actinophytocola sp.]|uniref:DNA glycosylase AlkZ-like family protein n=1 Tax=Actinophytocola sp. TaxID=1872138 RepID=UPI002DB79F7F|nr:crosslink repair DNA glycosylase YcaQ family protein [Actinophytocola sp.]HEU5472827.1 crosslink repair DNA glycosylase YcaQ family protein [Actinophytocola sp.]
MKALSRQAVVAHRANTQGLHAGLGRATEVGVLDIGIQDTPSGSAGQALAVRSGAVRTDEDPELVRVLSIRGAPHVHRRRDLPALRAVLRPRRAEDLLLWLGGHGPAFLDSGVDPLGVLDLVVTLLRERFPGKRASKGELSAVISPLLPAPARPWCEGCQADHVIENLFRLGTLLAGLELERGDRKLVFRPEPDAPRGRKRSTGPAGTAESPLLRDFLRYAGPLRVGDAAGWVVAGSVSGKSVPKPHGWAEIVDRAARVEIDGGSYLMDRAEADAVGDAPAPPVAVLLAPRDPYLLGNREFVVPDREVAKRVWRAQVSPGVLLVDGEVAGTWRQRISGRTVSVYVTPSGKMHKGVRAAVGDQAELLAAVRGAGALEPHVLWEG